MYYCRTLTGQINGNTAMLREIFYDYLAIYGFYDKIDFRGTSY